MMSFAAAIFASGYQSGVEYSYDDLGRVVRAEYPDGNRVIIYTYDPIGNRSQVEIAAIANTPPTATADSIAPTEDVIFEFSPLTNDTDAELDSLSIVAKTNGAKGTVTIIDSGQRLRYSPNANANGSDSFTYTISDGQANSSPATVTVAIGAVNDAPVAVNDSKSTNEDVALTFDPRANDSDVEGSPLTITAKTNGTKGSVAIVSSGTQLKYTPNANANGADSFTYTISDGALTNTAAVSMTINAVNDPPVAVTDTLATLYQTPKSITVTINDTDVDGNALTVTAKTNGAKGTVTITNAATGVLQYAPAAGSTGADSFTYTISDGNGGTAVGTVNVTIGNPPNTAPNAVNDTAFMPGSFNSVTISVLSNDSDPDVGDSILVISKTNGAYGTVSIGSGGQNVSYTFNGNPRPQTGSDTFTYTISDIPGATDAASVTVSWGELLE